MKRQEREEARHVMHRGTCLGKELCDVLALFLRDRLGRHLPVRPAHTCERHTASVLERAPRKVHQACFVRVCALVARMANALITGLNPTYRNLRKWPHSTTSMVERDCGSAECSSFLTQIEFRKDPSILCADYSGCVWAMLRQRCTATESQALRKGGTDCFQRFLQEKTQKMTDPTAARTAASTSLAPNPSMPVRHLFSNLLWSFTRENMREYATGEHRYSIPQAPEPRPLVEGRK